MAWNRAAQTSFRIQTSSRPDDPAGAFSRSEPWPNYRSPKKIVAVKVPKAMRNRASRRDDRQPAGARSSSTRSVGAGVPPRCWSEPKTDAGRGVSRKAGEVVNDMVGSAADAMSDVIGKAAKSILSATERAGKGQPGRNAQAEHLGH